MPNSNIFTVSYYAYFLSRRLNFSFTMYEAGSHFTPLCTEKAFFLGKKFRKCVIWKILGCFITVFRPFASFGRGVKSNFRLGNLRRQSQMQSTTNYVPKFGCVPPPPPPLKCAIFSKMEECLLENCYINLAGLTLG